MLNSNEIETVTRLRSIASQNGAAEWLIKDASSIIEEHSPESLELPITDENFIENISHLDGKIERVTNELARLLEIKKVVASKCPHKNVSLVPVAALMNETITYKWCNDCKREIS